MTVYLAVFFISLIITYVLTPLVKNIAEKLGVVDKPDIRRINDKIIPTMGGLAIYLAFFIAVLITLTLDKTLMGILIAGTFIIILGLFDDCYDLAPGIKLIGQVLAAIVLILFGVQIQFITNPLGGMLYLGIWGIPITIFWVVGITNTVNLIDGLDGLAAGVCAIAALTLFFVALQESQMYAAILAIALAASTLAFLKYNFHPAQIFMGDTGAMFCGFILAAIAIVGALKSAAAITLVVPLLALGVPIFDTVFAIVRRISKGKPIIQADHGHIHHRLLALGMDHKKAVLIVYAISLALGFVALLVNGTSFADTIILSVLAILGLVYVFTKLGIFSVDLPAEGASLEKS